MNADETISHEAKIAIAAAAKRKASDRLERDGNFSRDAIRHRLRALAHDRGIPPAGIAKAMRLNTRALVAFCEQHNVSCDWLMFGDLRGLPKTVQNAQPAPEIVEAQKCEIVQLLLAMPPGKRSIAIAALREMTGSAKGA
jgi:hypothetical protein